jgi:hypothetical protein
MKATLKRQPWPVLFALACCIFAAFLLAGCSTTGPGGQPLSSTQQAINGLTTSYTAFDMAVVAADVALKNGTLKGEDARNALRGFTTAKAGLDVALVALRNANAAAAAAAAAASAPPAPVLVPATPGVKP